MFTPQVNAVIPYFISGLLLIGFVCMIAFFRGVRMVNSRKNEPAQTPSSTELGSTEHGDIALKGQP